MTSDGDLGLGIWYLDHVIIVPDVQVVGPMTDDQYVKMADGKLVPVKQKSRPVRTALHTM